MGLIVGAICLGSLGIGLAFDFSGASRPTSTTALENAGLHQATSPQPGPPEVDVIRPAKGGLARKIVQTGSVEAYETAELVARVSGYLKNIRVDIGDEVIKGQVLAEIDAPEILKDVERQTAVLQQTESQELQAEARVKTVQAEKAAALGTVRQAEADVLRQTAERSFREKELERFRALVANQAIEHTLFDEKQRLWEAAKAGEEYARATLAIATAELRVIDSRIDQAKADLAVAKADVRVASADLARARVMADYLQIVAPFSGIITERNGNRGTYVQSAANGKEKPLLRLAQANHMRVVVHLAGPNVPFVRPGITATVSIDALGGETYFGKISRISHNQDPRTRTMRAEIDLPNLNGRLTSGMYGAVRIDVPPASDSVTVPKDCLVGRANNGRGQLIVVVDGRCQRRTVGLGHSEGERVEVHWNLAATDIVLANGSNSREELPDGAPVQITLVHETPSSAASGFNSTLQASR